MVENIVERDSFDKTKSVIITGACGGIGRVLVSQYALSHYHVIAIDKVSPPEWQGNIDFMQFDLSDVNNNQNFREVIKTQILALIGDNDLEALINNAAVQVIKPFEEINYEDWSITLNVNLLAPFFWSQMFLDKLILSNGSVLNISSIHAQQTKKQFSVYATSKAALSSLSKLLAIELGERIRVNVIEPGAISTQMLENSFEFNTQGREALDELQPMKRIGEPIEVAQLAMFLTSNSSKFINGSAIPIDGGIRNQLHDPE